MEKHEESMKFGVYVYDRLIYRYNDIMEAYKMAIDATEITSIPHEVKKISEKKENTVVTLLRQIREKKTIIKPYPQFVRLDECLDEIYELIKCNDKEKEYSIRVFTDRVKNRDDECFLGISYGIRLVQGKEVKWEKSFIQTHDSGIDSDISNFNRAMLLQVCDAIALYFQQYIYKWKDVKCKIVHDFKLGNDDAFKYNPSDSRVKYNIFDEEFGDKIAITLSGWR